MRLPRHLKGGTRMVAGEALDEVGGIDLAGPFLPEASEPASHRLADAVRHELCDGQGDAAPRCRLAQGKDIPFDIEPSLQNGQRISPASRTCKLHSRCHEADRVVFSAGSPAS